MWSDNESEIDLLRASYIARAVIRVVKTPDLLPTSIGVYGDWGSGKSTVLKMVERDLGHEENVLAVWFNGWLFEGYQDARSALMGSILDALNGRVESDKSRFQKAGERIVRLAKRVDLMRLTGVAVRAGIPALLGLPHLGLATAGVDLVAYAKDHAKDFKEEELQKLLRAAAPPAEVRRNVAEFRQEFAALLSELSLSAVVVVIDDLDRCLPPTIIETLEAIKLFLFVPQTAFVIGADERLIRHAVRLRFPELPGPDAEVGRDYLEKLIQIPITIPQLSGSEIESYMSLLFAQKHLNPADFTALLTRVEAERSSVIARPSFDLAVLRSGGASVPVGLEKDLELARQVAAVLATGLSGSPRRTKRFLNTLLLRLGMAEDRKLTLSRQILAKLMVLEYLKPTFYRQLGELQAAADGVPSALVEVERMARAPLLGADLPEEGVPSKAKRSTAPAGGELLPWLADEWTSAWLMSDPPLDRVDLRPYYFVARPRDTRLEGTGPVLSPAGETVLHGLLETDKVLAQQALSGLKALGDADAASLFERLSQRLRRAEKAESDTIQQRLTEVVKVRPALGASLVVVLSDMPHTKVAVATPMRLVEAIKGSAAAGAAETLLTTWKNSGADKLGKTATSALERLRD